MKPPKLKLITEFSDVEWIHKMLYPFEEEYFTRLGIHIPIGYESYLTIRHHNLDPYKANLGFLIWEKLILLLRDYTETPERCIAGIWNGFGWDFESTYPDLFRENSNSLLLKKSNLFENFFQLPYRSYYLVEADILDTLKIGYIRFNSFRLEIPNLLWPSDKSWFVVNEIDYDVTLLGGSENMIREIENSHFFATERFDPTIPNRDIFLADWPPQE